MVLKKFSFLCFCAFFALPVLAEPLAGEITKKEEKTPYVTFDPKQNVTDILDVSQQNTEEDIYFDADEIQTNQQDKVIEAIGNVEVRQGRLTLWADKLVYNQKTNMISAHGNVVLTEESGTKIFSDEVNLSDKLTTAEMDKIRVIMRDESKLWAEHFHKKENNNKVMRYAIYTPCDCCEENNGKAPLWRLRARKRGFSIVFFATTR